MCQFKIYGSLYFLVLEIKAVIYGETCGFSLECNLAPLIGSTGTPLVQVDTCALSFLLFTKSTSRLIFYSLGRIRLLCPAPHLHSPVSHHATTV
jgi:hypothetical protein